LNRLHLFFLALLFTMIGLGLFFYKAVMLDFPLVPEENSYTWNIEAHIGFNAGRKPVKVSLFLPQNTNHFTIVNENFISRGYGINTMTKNVNRIASWSIRRTTGPQDLYYSAMVRRVNKKKKSAAMIPPEIENPNFEGAYLEAAESLIAEIREKSADTGSFVAELLKHINDPLPDYNVSLLLGKQVSIPKRIDLAVRLFSKAGIPARSVHGILLREHARNIPLTHWLEVYDNNDWQFYDPVSGDAGIGNDFLVWWRGEEPLTTLEGGKNLSIMLSTLLIQEGAIYSAVERERIKKPLLLKFSLFELPIQTQAVYRILLMVPVGAFLLVILRNVVGLKTFGTFMPVLIALAFRETELFYGILIFTILIALGMSIRLYLEHLKLLLVPRLASVLIVVILLMVALSILTHELGLGRGISVALFPMVILTMTIERMSVEWEEVGPIEAIQQAVGSLVAATLAYLVMTIRYVEHLVFVFPELLFVLLALTLLMGRYSGYRLFELRRFRELSQRKP
jgi:hypothetical protein